MITNNIIAITEGMSLKGHFQGRETDRLFYPNMAITFDYIALCTTSVELFRFTYIVHIRHWPIDGLKVSMIDTLTSITLFWSITLLLKGRKKIPCSIHMYISKGAELASDTLPWHWLFFASPWSYTLKICLEIMIL